MCWVLVSTLATAGALAPVSNLGLRGGGFSRKTFNLGSCLQDHLDIMKSIPVSLLGQHMFPFLINTRGCIRAYFLVRRVSA